jgi:hypothetical protein
MKPASYFCVRQTGDDRKRPVRGSAQAGGGVVPRQEFIDPSSGMVCDAGNGVSQRSLWIDTVELCGLDQAVDGGSTLAAFIGASEQLVLAAEGDASERALSAVVDVTAAPLPPQHGIADDNCKVRLA